MVLINKLFVPTILSIAVAAPAPEVAAANGLVARTVDPAAVGNAVNGVLSEVVADIEDVVSDVFTGKIFSTSINDELTEAVGEIRGLCDKLTDLANSVDPSQVGTPSTNAVADFSKLKAVSARLSQKAAAYPHDGVFYDFICEVAECCAILVTACGKILALLPTECLALIALIANLLYTVCSVIV